jgi:hypothetical protein
VQRQQQLLPQLGSKSVNKREVGGSSKDEGKLSSAAVAAAGVYHTDDNGMTGYAGGW